jgi:hypothetical protein
MNCQDFDATWNDLLDAETPERRGPGAAGGKCIATLLAHEKALREHAGTCPRCGAAHDGYQTLRRALREWPESSRSLLGPSPALVERVIADAHRTPARRGRRRVLAVLAVGLAAAGSAIWFTPFGAGLGVVRRTETVAAQDPAATPDLARGAPAATAPESDLTLALADATAATLDLARTASAPATRVGIQILGAAAPSEPPPAANAPRPGRQLVDETSRTFLPSVLRMVTPERSRGDLLQDVGDGLVDGVRPLTSLAREAFGFLRPPSLERRSGAIHPPSSKGA